MPNVPMNISKVLAEQCNTNITPNTNLNPDAISKLNTVMYKMLGRSREVNIRKSRQPLDRRLQN